MKRRVRRANVNPVDYLSAEKRLLSLSMPRRPQAVILSVVPYPSTVANLGFLTIWERLNSHSGFTCDRAVWDPRTARFSSGLQSNLPLRQFPLIFISSSFELDLATVIDGLLTAGIEPEAKQRSDSDPILVAGGITLTLNPAPWSPILDLAILGEGEEAVLKWLEIYLSWRRQRGTKQQLLDESAKLPFVWIPAKSDRQVIPAQYSQYPTDPTSSPLTHPESHFGDCLLVEITRGCPHHCLFCAVCGVYQARFADNDAILRKISEGDCLGSKKVGLLGAATGDHPHLKEIVQQLLDADREVTISSLRIERTDEELLDLLVRAGLRTLTVAPETGSEEMRRKLGKKSADKELLRLVEMAGDAGLRKVKLYFLIGLPDPESPEVILKLMAELRQAASPKLALDLNVAAFIPKPGTPWERAPFADIVKLESVKKTLQQGLSNLPNVSVEFESTRLERQAALLARGDSALGAILLRSRRLKRSLEQELRLSGSDINQLLGPLDPHKPPPWNFIKRHPY